MKKIIFFLLTIIILFSLIGVYYYNNKETTKDYEKTITVAIYDPYDASIYYDLNINDRFKKIYPDVNIKIEEWKDESEYYNSLKIRAATGNLPDIMYIKPYKFMQYTDYFEDLSDLSVVKDNFFRKEYTVDEKVLGLPSVTKYDYIYYWKDLFDKADVKVPQTWEDFMSVSTKLQTFYKKENQDFKALAIGARDEWTIAPFVDIIPIINSGNGSIWNDIVDFDYPFSEGSEIYKAFLKIKELFASGVCGNDPLAIGHNEAVAKFSHKKSAMIIGGPSCLSEIGSNIDDISYLSTFYLPVRDSINDTFCICLQSDNVLTVSNSSKNVDIAKEFIEFFFSNDWYPNFIKASKNDSSLSNNIVEKQSVFYDADKNQKNKIVINYFPNSVELNYLLEKTNINNKDIGLQLFLKDFDFDHEFNKYNTIWKNAKEQSDDN